MSGNSGAATRVEAQADSLMKGLREDLGAAVILETWARSEIDGDEARRRRDA